MEIVSLIRMTGRGWVMAIGERNRGTVDEREMVPYVDEGIHTFKDDESIRNLTTENPLSRMQLRNQGWPS